ncbi:MAG: DUF3568 domain-containing protein [Puniceicoccales bacterium]|nr:DUF3568 domain-containing protein [Puniceicoccales bacterium]
MKKLASLIALAAIALIPFSGCTTDVGVKNQYNNDNGQYDSFGNFTTKYPGKTLEEVFNASLKGVDQVYGAGRRVGENRPDGKPNSPKTYEIWARVAGDIKITVTIGTVRDEKTKTEWTQVSTQYGAFGNLKESQKLIAAISGNL